MNLNEQLLSIIFSIAYGIVLAYIYNLNYKFIYQTDILYKILINFLLVTNVVLIYFILLSKINNGIVHEYLLIVSAIVFLLFSEKYKSLRKIFNLKRKVNVKLLKRRL
jgi:hypothetical protein